MRLVKLSMEIDRREGEDDRFESVTTPVYINPETVRSIRGRKPSDDGTPNPGTRIEFPNSSAIIVTEELEAVRAALTEA